MWKLAALNFAIQWSGWAIASILQSEKFYDLTGKKVLLSYLGSLTYILLTGQIYWNIDNSDNVHRMQAACVIAWATRLGSFLFYRILKDGRDRRFKEIKRSPVQFFIAWTLQGVWVMITLLPTIQMLTSRFRTPTIPARAKIGFALWAAGFLIESTADQQKLKFKANPQNNGMFVKSGLWSYSRHPNYFGEIIMWLGLWLSASTKFTQPIHYASILCPMFDFLLISKISGIPMLESYASKKWGHLAEYQHYAENTAVMIHFVW